MTQVPYLTLYTENDYLLCYFGCLRETNLTLVHVDRYRWYCIIHFVVSYVHECFT